jgi:hypothetical protein
MEKPRAFHNGRCSRTDSPASLRRAAAAVAVVSLCTGRLSVLNITRFCACIAMSTAVSLDLEPLAAPRFTGGRPAPAEATPFTGGRLTPPELPR